MCIYTSPVFFTRRTIGTYIYATDFDIANRRATIHAESQVKNDDSKPHTFSLMARMLDADGHEVTRFNGERITMQPGETRIVHISQPVSGLHFWTWGYGYLYTIETAIMEGLDCYDVVTTRTGFRKTRFGEGKIWLNDRVLMVHGYAQRTDGGIGR